MKMFSLLVLTGLALAAAAEDGGYDGPMAIGFNDAARNAGYKPYEDRERAYKDEAGKYGAPSYEEWGEYGSDYGPDPTYPVDGKKDDYYSSNRDVKDGNSLAGFIDLYFSKLFEFINSSVREHPECKRGANGLAQFYSRDATQFALLSIQDGREEIRKFFFFLCSVLNNVFNEGVTGRLLNAKFEPGNVYFLQYREAKKLAYASFAYELVVKITFPLIPGFGFDVVIPVRETLNLERAKGKKPFAPLGWLITHSHESIDVENVFAQLLEMQRQVQQFDETFEIDFDAMRNEMAPMMSHAFEYYEDEAQAQGLGLAGRK